LFLIVFIVYNIVSSIFDMFPLLTERKNITIVFSVENRSDMVFGMYTCIRVCIMLYIHTYVHTTYRIRDNIVNSVYIAVILSHAAVGMQGIYLQCTMQPYIVRCFNASSSCIVIPTQQCFATVTAAYAYMVSYSRHVPFFFVLCTQRLQSAACIATLWFHSLLCILFLHVMSCYVMLCPT